MANICSRFHYIMHVLHYHKYEDQHDPGADLWVGPGCAQAPSPSFPQIDRWPVGLFSQIHESNNSE